jgi:hypothetical protein
MPPVGRQNLTRAKPLGYRDDRRIDEPERKVAITVNQIANSREIRILELLDDKLSFSNSTNERLFSRCSDASLKEVADFGENRHRQNHSAAAASPPRRYALVPTVTGVDERVDRTRVRNDR